MKIAVIGGRDFNDYPTLSFIVSEHKPSMLISGGAKGADALAEKFSRDFGTPIKVYRANWNDFTPPCKILKNKWGQMYNALSGMNRNTKIIEDCDMVIAFWNGVSTGTKDSIEKAKALNKKVVVIPY